MKINYNEIYTLDEVQSILKISRSTLLRLIKRGRIKTAKVGRQHRILGQEILQMVSPEKVKNHEENANKTNELVHPQIIDTAK